MAKLSDTAIYDLQYLLLDQIGKGWEHLGIGPTRLVGIYHELMSDFVDLEARSGGAQRGTKEYADARKAAHADALRRLDHAIRKMGRANAR